nr:hypothetical protein [Streptomyces yerevanensis]
MKIQADAPLFGNGTLVSPLESVHRCWTRRVEGYGTTAEEFARVDLHGRPAAETAADLLPAMGEGPGGRRTHRAAGGRGRGGRRATAAGRTTVALTTTHQAVELAADVVVEDLSAVSALVMGAGLEISARV